MAWVRYLSLALLFAAIVNSTSSAEQIPQRYLDVDHASCMSACGAKGAPVNWCKANCDCSVEKESEQFTLEEYLEMVRLMSQGKDPPKPLLDRITRIALDCAIEVKKSLPTATPTPTATPVPSSTSGSLAENALAELLTEHYGRPIARQVAAGDKELAWCVGKAMAEGIPAADQAIMVNAISTKRLTPESQYLIARWLGGASIHGPLRRPEFNDPTTYKNGHLSYSDGTEELPTDKAATERIEANIHRMCPQYESLLTSR